MKHQKTKVALVTGASSGIGRAAAIALSQAGYRVFGTSRKATANGPSGVEMLVCDIANDDSVARCVAQVMAAAGRIDVLVNNAGLGLTGAAEEVSIDIAKALFDVNVFGTMRVIQNVLPIMRRQNGGRIVNISSVLGFIPAPYMALYAATKHAIEGYSESLDHEVRTMGVRVVLVEPAYTQTAFDTNAIRADRPLSIYDEGRKSADAVMLTAMTTGDRPEIVGAAVLAAAEAPAPKLRYPAGKQAKQVTVLRRFVPASAFDKSLRKQNGLPV